MKKVCLLLVIVFGVFLYSCKKGCTDPSATNYDEKAKKDDGSCQYDNIHIYDAHLFADYSNPVNGSPSLTVKLNLSSPEINIEQDPTISELNGRILFNYGGITFKEGKKVYRIDKILTERKAANKWIEDDENFLSSTFSKSLDIVLVLDVSSSLGPNLQTIKQRAIDFVYSIISNNPEARIGVLKFSRGTKFRDFTSDPFILESFIELNSTYSDPQIGTYNLEGRSETSLYEAVDSAVSLLNNSGARGRGIVTFTDGVNNFQFDPVHFTPDQLIANLNSSSISSYTIGFEGNGNTVDRSALKQISINGDFSFPKNTTELEAVFTRFSNSVAAVYDLIYDTNNGKFEGIQEYRFLFRTTKISG